VPRVGAKVSASEIQATDDDSGTQARAALTSSARHCLYGPSTYCRRVTLESMLTVGDRPIAMTTRPTDPDKPSLPFPLRRLRGTREEDPTIVDIWRHLGKQPPDETWLDRSDV